MARTFVMQDRSHYLERILVLISLIFWMQMTEGCLRPEKGSRFGDLALRSDIVVVATPTQVKKAPQYSALFRVTKLFNAKSGDLRFGTIFLSGTFGTRNACTRPKPGRKYIMFLQTSTSVVEGRPFHKIRYNPVPSSARNIRFFSNVLAGKQRRSLLQASGCRKMRTPTNSKLACSARYFRCRIICKAGFKHTTGQRFRTCITASGSWYPSKAAKCVPISSSINSNSETSSTPAGTVPRTLKTANVKVSGKKNSSKAKTKTAKSSQSDQTRLQKHLPHNELTERKNTVKKSVITPNRNQKSTPQPSPTGTQISTSIPVTTERLQTSTERNGRNALQQHRSATTIGSLSNATSTAATQTTTKIRPKLPIYTPLKPLNRRRVFVPYRRKQYVTKSPAVTTEATLKGDPFDSFEPPSRPPLPTYRPLATLGNRRLRPIRTQVIPTFRPRSLVLLKAATPAQVIGELIENINDKFALVRVGDEWQTEDGLTFKPELTVNETVYGCPYFETNMTVFGAWQGGFNAMIKFEKLKSPIMGGWMVRVEFSTPIVDIETHVVDFYLGTEDRTVVTFIPKPYMEVLHVNQDLTVAFVAELKSSQAFAPSAKGFLLGKCSEDQINGRAVGSMFQGRTVLDGYGPDSKSHSVPSLPATENVSTKSTTTETTTTLPTDPTTLRTQGQSQPIAPGRLVARPRSAGRSRTTNRVRSTRLITPENWLKNRCLHLSPNGVLPVGGMTKPRWMESRKKSKYDYNEVLHKSGLFFLAQKSGKLPSGFDIPWRGDSALKDGCQKRHQLYGGLYNGGGHEKNTVAIAFTTTMLAWGAIDYREAYEDAGEYDNVVDLITENARYLIRCHIAKEELVVQVGNHDSSGKSWSRPEEIAIENRPIYKITREKPGQDAAAETAAALAASSILLKYSNTTLSRECLKHAKELDVMARRYSGQYSRLIPKSVNNYHSISNTLDNLAWALIWLGKATNIQGYYKRAIVLYSKFASKEVDKFDWSEKSHAIPILLTKFAKRANYNWRGKKTINIYREKAAKSQSKLLHLGAKGSNMLAANAAFLALQVAQLNKDTSVAASAVKFAEEQLHFLLGDGGRSYVVGFGKNYPKRPRHMASSCRDVPYQCDSSILRSSSDNPHTLYGALVGGPDRSGKFNDLITEKLQNEVAIDFNAGFQSAIAGLKQSKLPGKSLAGAGTVDTIGRTGTPVRKNASG